jgi:transcriptional regulator with XRE-family HTH domain
MRCNGHQPGSSADVGAFGNTLRLHRRRLGLSQEDLADATRGGVATRTISDLERGVARRPRAETVRLLAAALGLTGADLAVGGRRGGRRTDGARRHRPGGGEQARRRGR